MSKKKSKIVFNAESWVTMMDAKADLEPKKISSILWKLGGMVSIPFVSFGLMALCLIFVIIGIFNHIFWHCAAGIVLSTLVVTIWNSIEKYQERKEIESRKRKSLK